MASMDKIVARHYETHWGRPTASYEAVWGSQQSAKGIFHVEEFAPGHGRNVWTYASAGMSSHAMPGAVACEDGTRTRRRVELLMYSYPGCRELVDFLGKLVVFPFVNHTAIWAGHTIPGGDAIVPDSAMTSVCFFFPRFEAEGFQPLCLNGDHIFVLWALPIYEVERQYKIAHGSAALWRLFVEKDMDFPDLRRKPVL